MIRPRGRTGLTRESGTDRAELARFGAVSRQRRRFCPIWPHPGPLACLRQRGPCGKNRPPEGAFEADSFDTGHAAVAQW